MLVLDKLEKKIQKLKRQCKGFCPDEAIDVYDRAIDDVLLMVSYYKKLQEKECKKCKGDLS